MKRTDIPYSIIYKRNSKELRQQLALSFMARKYGVEDIFWLDSEFSDEDSSLLNICVPEVTFDELSQACRRLFVSIINKLIDGDCEKMIYRAEREILGTF